MTSDGALVWFGEWLAGGAVTAMRRTPDVLTLDLSLVHGVDPSEPMQLRLFGVGTCAVSEGARVEDWAAFERDLSADLGVFDLKRGALTRGADGRIALQLDGVVFPENLARRARFEAERFSCHREDGSELQLDVLSALHALWAARRAAPKTG